VAPGKLEVGTSPGPASRAATRDLFQPSDDIVIDIYGPAVARRAAGHLGRSTRGISVLSAHGKVAAAEHLPGVLGTLRKPFEIRQLLSLVNKHC
jgi:hypothetical protein